MKYAKKCVFFRKYLVISKKSSTFAPAFEIKQVFLAQLVEQLTLNQWVQGSSPWEDTKDIQSDVFFLCSYRTSTLLLEFQKKIEDYASSLLPIKSSKYSENISYYHSYARKITKSYIFFLRKRRILVYVKKKL